MQESLIWNWSPTKLERVQTLKNWVENSKKKKLRIYHEILIKERPVIETTMFSTKTNYKLNGAWTQMSTVLFCSRVEKIQQTLTLKQKPQSYTSVSFHSMHHTCIVIIIVIMHPWTRSECICIENYSFVAEITKPQRTT